MKQRITVKLQYWPVLSRGQGSEGKSKRKGSYQRTALALREREESLIRLSSRTRVALTWGSAGEVEFSLSTGRCVGVPDWVMTKDSRKALRRLAREQSPMATAGEPTQRALALDASASDAEPAKGA